MYGLIIKKKWLDLILQGEKTLEIRGSNTRHCGEKIALLESGACLLRGTAVIAGTFPMSCSDYYEEACRHCINTTEFTYRDLKHRYNTPWAWELDRVVASQLPDLRLTP